jgi:hypothetical protein
MSCCAEFLVNVPAMSVKFVSSVCQDAPNLLVICTSQYCDGNWVLECMELHVMLCRIPRQCAGNVRQVCVQCMPRCTKLACDMYQPVL